MELVERYLQAVAGYLPKAQGPDIIAELKDSLLSGIEEQEQALGRALTEPELQTLLKQHGHPMLVAGRYLPQQYLIGPSVFPFWWFGLRLVLLVVAALYAVLTGIQIVHSGHLIQAIVQGLFGFAGTALFYIAVLTLVLALLDRYQVRIGLLDNWQPVKLAPVKQLLKISRGEALFEIVISALFISWWLGWLHFPAVIFHDSAALPIKLSAAWQPYWWAILLLSVADLLLSGFNFLFPHWQWDRLLLRLLLNVIAIGLCYTLYTQDVLVVLADATANASVERIVTLLNRSVHIVLIVITLIALAEMVQDVRRLLQLR